MGLRDWFAKRRAKTEEELEKASLETIKSLAKEGKTKEGYFKCVRCNKIYPISFFGCYGWYNNNRETTILRAICRVCLQEDKERGINRAYGKPIEEVMRTGEVISYYYNLALKKKERKV